MVQSYYLPKEAEFIMEGAPEGVADVIIERMEGEKGDVIGVAMLVGDV